jgi:hypothetical protein
MPSDLGVRVQVFAVSHGSRQAAARASERRTISAVIARFLVDRELAIGSRRPLRHLENTRQIGFTVQLDGHVP